MTGSEVAVSNPLPAWAILLLAGASPFVVWAVTVVGAWASCRRREVAEHRGVTVSDLLREAADRIVGFYEDDEPAAKIQAAFEAGIERGYAGTTGHIPPATLTWGCPHITMSGPFPCAPTTWCGCVMSLVEATR